MDGREAICELGARNVDTEPVSAPDHGAHTCHAHLRVRTMLVPSLAIAPGVSCGCAGRSLTTTLTRSAAAGTIHKPELQCSVSASSEMHWALLLTGLHGACIRTMWGDILRTVLFQE